MADSFTFEVKGVEQLTKSFQDLRTRLVVSVFDYITKVVEHVISRAAVNAPILSGDLRAALTGFIDGVPISQAKPNPKADKIEGKVVDTMAYALRMHEDFYNLGPISSIQPDTPEGGVGRKYISRVVQYHLAKYEQGLQQVVKAVLPPGSTFKVNVNFSG